MVDIASCRPFAHLLDCRSIFPPGAPAVIVHVVTHPENFINHQKKSLLESGPGSVCFALKFEHEQYYLPGKPIISLLALIAISRTQQQSSLCVAIAPFEKALGDQIDVLACEPDALKQFAVEHQLGWHEMHSPMLLEPVHIPKPWGQEVWYTGIEARGQSAVTAQEASTPLPWLLSLMPEALAAGKERQLILLKILDPLPEEVYGDLYFEMHEEKQEVYIVTHVDRSAWPDGVGCIRLGFNRELLKTYSSEMGFKQAYLAAVKDYEVVRRKIDEVFDKNRIENGMQLNDPVNAKILKTWQSQLAPALITEEHEKRRAMDAFTNMQPITVGDVIKVPQFTPHALQHGVRTVEFQTPVYERKILSFAQKVLTQSHWDTEAVLAQLNLEAPEQPSFQKLTATEDCLIERVVSFDNFEVQRVNLNPHSCYSLNETDSYRILMIISGSVKLISGSFEGNTTELTDTQTYHPGQSVLLSAATPLGKWRAGESGAILLVAAPR